MKATLLATSLLVISLSLLVCPVAAAPQEDFPTRGAVSPVDGDWAGILNVGATALHLALHVHTKTASSLIQVTLDSLDQGAKGIPGDNAKLDGAKFSFDFPSINGRYAGKLSTDGNTISGIWNQGQSLPLDFKRADNSSSKIELPPASITERQVSFATTDGPQVPGTLTLPAHHTGPVPVIVMVQGSGVQDRDATVGPNKIFRDLAWGLAEQNVATLRYDRRPRFAPASFMQHPDLDHEITLDAVSALRYVSAIDELDPHQVYLLGHSLGGTMAPYIVHARLAEPQVEVAGIILLAAGAVPVDAAISRQVHDLGKLRGASDNQISSLQNQWQTVFTEAKDPKTPAEKPLGVGSMIPALYWRDWMSRDPSAVLSKLPVPALVIRGKKDLNVTHAEFEILAKVATAPGSEAQEFSDLNHSFQPVSGGPNGYDELLPRRVSSTVVKAIATWVRRNHKEQVAPCDLVLRR